MRRNRGTTAFRNALPGFQVGFVALDVPERTVATKFVDIVEPARARPVRSRVRNAEPGRVPFRRTDTGEFQLPVAFQRTEVVLSRTFIANTRTTAVRRCDDGLAEFTADILVGNRKSDVTVRVRVGYLTHGIPRGDFAVHLGLDVVDEDDRRHERFTGGEVDPDGLTGLDNTIRLDGDFGKHGWHAVFTRFRQIVFRYGVVTVARGQQ